MLHTSFISKEIGEVYLNEGPEMVVLVCEINANFIDLQCLSPRTVGGHLLKGVGHINFNSSWGLC